MTEAAEEHERTMAFAEIALGQIKALRQPATPRNYEIWYTYATGYNPSLNQTINETLARNGTLTEADLEQVYATYISPTRLTDKHRQRRLRGHGRDRAGHGDDRRRGRLGHRATPKASPASRNKLGNAKDREGLRAIVESLVQTANEMQNEQQHAGSAAQRLASRKSTSCRRISRRSAPKA